MRIGDAEAQLFGELTEKAVRGVKRGQGDASRQVIQMLKSLSFNAVKTFHDVKVSE